jgi:hypothetical protein
MRGFISPMNLQTFTLSPVRIGILRISGTQNFRWDHFQMTSMIILY